jgi:hypothetical protein
LNASVPRSAQAAADAFGFEAEFGLAVRWDAQAPAYVFGALNGAEHERRQRACIGHLRRQDIFRLRTETTEQTETLRSPLTVTGVVVVRRDARRAITAASYFAPLARRGAVATGGRLNRDEAVARGLWFEVGVAIATDDAVEVLTEPGPAYGEDPWYRWAFTEVVYREYLTALSASQLPA